MSSKIVHRTLVSRSKLFHNKFSLQSTAWIQTTPLHTFVHNNQAARPSNAMPSFEFQQYRMGHTVRVILVNDLEEGEGKGYKGDVLTVKAGYARNFLLPQKKAVYATPKNFESHCVLDPLELAEKEKIPEVSAGTEEEMEEMTENLRQADVLRRYLKNKIVKIHRNVDSNGNLHPGMVDTRALRLKLSKQLKIDLDTDEHVQIHPEAVASFLQFDDDNFMENFLTQTMADIDKEKDDNMQLKQIGDYVAKIVLKGGHLVPLKFTIMKR